MKRIFVLLVFIGTIFSGFSQDAIVITVDGQVDDLSSGAAPYTITAPSSSTFDVPFDVYNNSAGTQKWRITRVQLAVPTGWADGLCWGHSTDPFGGSCFSSTQMIGSPWTTPGGATNLFDLLPGEYGKMKPSIDPGDGIYGSAHYRYYITSAGGAYLDSVDLIVDYLAEVKPIKEPVTVSIVPNPASDYINIQLSGSDHLNMKMVDAMGSVLLKESISNSKKINTSEFRSGVYFLTFEGPSTKPFTRKVIIRH